jgi:GxxExxY protein
VPFHPSHRAPSNEHREAARFHHFSHGQVVQRQIVGTEFKGHGLPLSRLERETVKAFERPDRPGHARGIVAQVQQGSIDLIVAKQIVVELKAVDRLRDVHYAQLKSYLRATSHRVGLFFNFNAPTLTTKRMVVD